jgi:hypothetical protein
MRKIVALAALLAAGAAHAQTYDLAVDGSTFGFGGSFTFNASTDTFSNINLGGFDYTLNGGGGGDSYTFYNCLVNCQAPEAIEFTTNVPLGTLGPIEITGAMLELMNSVDFCASTPGTGSFVGQQVCSTETITAVPNATAAPEIDSSRAIAALSLLAGAVLVLKSSGARVP